MASHFQCPKVQITGQRPAQKYVAKVQHPHYLWVFSDTALHRCGIYGCWLYPPATSAAESGRLSDEWRLSALRTKIINVIKSINHQAIKQSIIIANIVNLQQCCTDYNTPQQNNEDKKDMQKYINLT